MKLVKFNAKNFVTLTDSELQETNGGMSLLGPQIINFIIKHSFKK
jgi:hypothetical protein